jgi:hypothetical protein
MHLGVLSAPGLNTLGMKDTCWNDKVCENEGCLIRVEGSINFVEGLLNLSFKSVIRAYDAQQKATSPHADYKAAH